MGWLLSSDRLLALLRSGVGLLVALVVLVLGSAAAASPPGAHDYDANLSPAVCPSDAPRALASGLAAGPAPVDYIYDDAAQLARTSALEHAGFFAPQTGGGGVTAVDLYATSNGKNQRPKPRPRDLGVDSSDDDVCPGSSDGISYGLSTFAREGDLITRGWVWKLPAGSPLPPGLRVEADGRDYVPGSPMPTSHHTLALTGSMSFAGAVALYQGLNWQPMGYERK